MSTDEIASTELRIQIWKMVMAKNLDPAVVLTKWIDQSTDEVVVRFDVVDAPHICLRFDGSDVCVFCGNDDYSTWPSEAS